MNPRIKLSTQISTRLTDVKRIIRVYGENNTEPVFLSCDFAQEGDPVYFTPEPSTEPERSSSR